MGVWEVRRCRGEAFESLTAAGDVNCNAFASKDGYSLVQMEPQHMEPHQTSQAAHDSASCSSSFVSNDSRCGNGSPVAAVAVVRAVGGRDAPKAPQPSLPASRRPTLTTAPPEEPEEEPVMGRTDARRSFPEHL